MDYWLCIELVNVKQQGGGAEIERFCSKTQAISNSFLQ